MKFTFAIALFIGALTQEAVGTNLKKEVYQETASFLGENPYNYFE